jgi:hypothetical protein
MSNSAMLITARNLKLEFRNGRTKTFLEIGPPLVETVISSERRHQRQSSRRPSRFVQVTAV